MSNTIGLPGISQMYPGAFFEAHRDEVMSAIARVLESGRYILGDEVRSFEQEFARQFGYGGAVGVANGTDAIALALRSLGVGHGDRVATVSHTAVATVAAIEMVGASPVFVDITADTYTLDPQSLARTLERSKPVKAVIAVHLYGHPAAIATITQVSRQFRIHLVEDCAQAHGARVGGRFVGSWADAAAFSFYPTKNLGAFGDGGMVVSDDSAQLKRVRMLREYGWARRYISDFPGINSRLDELQAAVLRVRLPYLDAGNRRRARIAAAYDAGLAGTGLMLPVAREGATHVYHQYVVRHPDRDGFRRRLKEKGVDTIVHYPMPVHCQPAYAGRCDVDPYGLGVTDSIVREIVSLPMYPELAEDTIAAIISAVRSSV